MEQVFAYRIADEPLTYRQIGGLTGVDEAALRMRVTRFSRSVRAECHRLNDRISMSG